MDKFGRFRRFMNLPFCYLLVMNLWSCGEDTDGTSVQPSFSSLYVNVFQGCTSAGACHGGSGTQPDVGGWDFPTSPDEFYTKVVDKTPADHGWIASCDSTKLINPGSAVTSLIAGSMVTSVYDTWQGSPCVPAHSNKEALNLLISGDNATALTNWINDGALNN